MPVRGLQVLNIKISSNYKYGIPTDLAPACDGVGGTDWSCCSSVRQCNVGGGDCDDDSECHGDLVCGSDNCKAEFSVGGSSWAGTADCCKPAVGNYTGVNGVPYVPLIKCLGFVR